MRASAIHHGLVHKAVMFLCMIAASDFTWAQPTIQPDRAKVTRNEAGAPMIRNYSPNEYNANMQNWAVVQDSRGVMYFGNTDGVLEFDGSSWRLIQTNNQSIVRALAVGPDDRVYVGGINDIGRLEPHARLKMRYVSLVDKIPLQYRKFGDIFFVIATPQGIYFATTTLIFRLFKERIDVIRRDDFIKLQIHRANDTLYVYNRKKDETSALYTLDGSRLTPVPFPDVLANQVIFSILPYDREKLLISGTKNLYVFDPKLAQRTPEQVDTSAVCRRFPNEASSYLTGKGVYLGALYDKQRYIYNTLTGGILILDANGKVTRLIDKHIGLGDNRVWGMYIDSDGNLWAAMNRGLAHIEINSPLSVYNEHTGLEHTVLGFGQISDRLFVSSFNGVFELSQTMLDHRVSVNTFRPVPGYPTIETFVIGEMNRRLYAFPNYKNSFRIDRQRAEPGSSIPIDLVMSACSSKRYPGHLFLGLQSKGFAIMRSDPDSDLISLLVPSEADSATLTDTVQKIVCDDKGDVWLGAYTGLYQVRFSHDSLHDFELRLHDTDTQGIVFMPNQLGLIEGELVFATEKGLYKSIPDPSRKYGLGFVPAESVAGVRIPNHAEITGLHAYADGIILTSTKGRYSIQRKTRQNEYRPDRISLAKLDTEGQRAHIDSDGIIWIGTMDGLYRYDPGIPKKYTSDYTVLLRDIRFRETTQTQPADSIEVFNAAFAAIPELSYDQNHIAFSFAATFYEQPEANRFSYRLEGFDRTFSPWSQERHKEYTNLPEGEYRFVVRAKNIFDQQGRAASFRFSILPPWYRTYLAYLVYLIIFVGIIYVSVRVNSRRLMAAKDRLERIVTQRTEEVRSQKKQLEIKNREIGTAYQDLKTTHQQLKQTQSQLLDASWKAGMADVASGVLHNVGNALTSVFVSKNLILERLKRSRINNLNKAVEIVANPQDFKPSSERGLKTSEYLSLLSDQMIAEHRINLEEFDKLDKSLQHVGSIVAAQQRYTKTTAIQEDLRPRELIASALEMSRMASDEIHIEITITTDFNETIRTERQKVIQILIHLFNYVKSSLIKANNPIKSMTITTASIDQDRFSIEVRDNGMGLDADALQRVFSFTVGESVQADALDLHASANAAKSIGGRLRAESEGPQRGSTFMLELPKRSSGPK